MPFYFYLAQRTVRKQKNILFQETRRGDLPNNGVAQTNTFRLSSSFSVYWKTICFFSFPHTEDIRLRIIQMIGLLLSANLSPNSTFFATKCIQKTKLNVLYNNFPCDNIKMLSIPMVLPSFLSLQLSVLRGVSFIIEQ